MITVGMYVIWNGRCGIVRNIGFSRACDMAVAAVEFNFRETLRLPVDELVSVAEEKA